MSGEILQQDGDFILQQDSFAILQQDGVAGSSFTIAPASGHAITTVSITATGVGTTWTDSNPFSVSGSSTGSATITGYQLAAGGGTTTSRTFNLVITALGNIVIDDSNSSTNQTYDANPVAPGAPTSVTVTDNHHGTLTVAFVAPADNGGAAITGYTATWASGSSNTGANSPITVTLVGIENLVSGTMAVTATNSAGTGVAGTSAALIPNNTNTVTYVMDFTFPLGVVAGSGLAYRVWGREGGTITLITGWITTGLVITTSMTGGASQQEGYTVNATIPWNNASTHGFNGLIELRNASSSPTYVRMELNVYTSLRSATEHVVKIHTFHPALTITAAGIRVFTNTAGTDADNVAHTSTGVVTVDAATKCYAYDVALAPSAQGGMDKFIVWDNGGGSPIYDYQDTVTIPATAVSAGDKAFNVSAIWAPGTPLGTVGWIARKIVAGVLTDIGTWSASGVASTAGMDGVGQQYAAVTINASLSPTESDGSVIAEILVRSNSTLGAYVLLPCNLPGAATPGATITNMKVMPSLETDPPFTPGYQVFTNTAGTLANVGSHVTSGIVVNPEVVNGYVARVAWPSSAAAFVLWDEDATTDIYMQDIGGNAFVTSPAGGGMGSGRAHKRALYLKTRWGA